MKLTIFTLVTENYIPGLVALINSLRANGCSGTIIVGKDKDLKIDSEYENVEFVNVETDGYWMGNLKPEFLLNNKCEKFLFIDSDIVINSAEFINNIIDWIDDSLVLSIESILPTNDYRRKIWNNGNRDKNECMNDYYYNSGLMGGIWERDKYLLEEWDHEIKSNISKPGRLFQNYAYTMADQDALNAILQNNNEIISFTSPDIWFSSFPEKPFIHVGGYKEYSLLHCTGYSKTWNINKIPSYSPTPYDLAWYKYVKKENAFTNYKVHIPFLIEWWLKDNILIKIFQKILRIIK